LRPHDDIAAVDGRLLDELTTIVSAAAAAILAARAGSLEVRAKADLSPVTAADHAAEALILEGLARLLPGVCVVSEEAAGCAPPDRIPDSFVLVDPLDGTRELLAGRDEFTINVAGHSFGLFGMNGFFLTFASFTPAVAAMFLFQMVFMDTTATIPTGALAERWRFTSFVIYSFVIATLIYPVYGNWVWGGGWLAQLGKNFGLGHGHVDFAGSSVVHMIGGVSALVGARVLGPRIGKFDLAGRARPIPGHNMPMVALGTFILAFGWFGFNAGSTLAGTDTRIAVIAVNTMLASASGAFAAYLWTKTRFGAPDVSMLCNGMLGGMVAITAPCAFVSSPTAIFIGAVAGVLVIVSALFIENTLKIDDPVGASSVHGTCGAWGILSLGLFADGRYGEGWNGVPGTVRGLMYGDAGQLAAAIEQRKLLDGFLPHQVQPLLA